MADVTTIKLGDRSFDIEPLTLGQLEDLSDAFTSQGDVTNSTLRQRWKRHYLVILAAMQGTHPEVTEDELKAIKGSSYPELVAAETVCLRHAGLLPKEEAKPGEARPATAPAG